MTDRDEKIDEMKDVFRENQKEDGAFDGRFVERSVPDKRKEKERRACRGEQEREAIEKSMEQMVDTEQCKGCSRIEVEREVYNNLQNDFEHDKVQELVQLHFDELYEKYDDAEKIVDKILLKENEGKLEDEEPDYNPFAEELKNE